MALHGSMVSPVSFVIPFRDSSAGSESVPLRPRNSRLAAVYVMTGSLTAVNATYCENWGSKLL